MAENLTFKDIESEAEHPIDSIQINTQEEKKGDSLSRSNNGKSTPSSNAQNILKARTGVKGPQEVEVSSLQ